MPDFLSDKSENFTEKHWEDIIILLTLISVAAIHYFIYSKSVLVEIKFF